MQSNVKKLKVGLQYYLFRTGPLTMAAGPAALFVRTRQELASPDVKISVAPFSSDKLQDGLHPWSGFGLTVYQLRPESRGEIRLKSRQSGRSAGDAAELPGDRDRSPRHRRWPEDRPAHPGHAATCSTSSPRNTSLARRCTTDEQLLEHARNTGGTVFHPTSTCKMGVDPMAVVDPELRVYGIEGLRVVDASIMPTVISGNTNAATIMIGEKAADLVRQTRCAWRHERLPALRRSDRHQRLRHGHAAVGRPHASRKSRPRWSPPPSECVDMIDLAGRCLPRDRADHRCAGGIVTSGASAGMLLGAAACLAGLDPARMNRLPEVADGRNAVHRRAQSAQHVRPRHCDRRRPHR